MPHHKNQQDNAKNSEQLTSGEKFIKSKWCMPAFILVAVANTVLGINFYYKSTKLDQQRQNIQKAFKNNSIPLLQTHKDEKTGVETVDTLILISAKTYNQVMGGLKDNSEDTVSPPPQPPSMVSNGPVPNIL